jgi:DNA-binding MarR family transcriptional regulator
VPTTVALGNELLRSSARLSRWASRHASFDVPFAQARLLALLDELGPARVSTLAIADHSSQPTITGQLQRLESHGWARREQDPDDARASLMSLTDEGRGKLESLRDARVAVLAPLLDELDDDGVEELRIAVAVLGRLLDSAARSTQRPRHTAPTRTTAADRTTPAAGTTQASGTTQAGGTIPAAGTTSPARGAASPASAT